MTAHTGWSTHTAELMVMAANCSVSCRVRDIASIVACRSRRSSISDEAVSSTKTPPPDPSARVAQASPAQACSPGCWRTRPRRRSRRCHRCPPSPARSPAPRCTTADGGITELSRSRLKSATPAACSAASKAASPGRAGPCPLADPNEQVGTRARIAVRLGYLVPTSVRRRGLRDARWDCHRFLLLMGRVLLSGWGLAGIPRRHSA